MPPGAPPAGSPATPPAAPGEGKEAGGELKKELTAAEYDALPEDEKEKYEWDGEKYVLKEDTAPKDNHH